MARKLLPLSLGVVLLCAACGGDDDGGEADATPVPDADVRGTVSFNWTLSDGSGPIPCEAVNASAMGITFLPIGVLGSSSDSGNCPDGAMSGMFESSPLPPRDYDIEITLSASQGDLIDAPITFDSITVEPLQNTDLGDVDFVVDPVGNLSFRLRAAETGGNCETVANNGAEIVKFELELSQGGTCIPTDFVIFDGATQEATYSTSCAGEQFAMCIAEDRVLQVTDLGSGPTVVDIIGYRAGDLPCYAGAANIDIPGNGLEADVGAVNIPRDMLNETCFPP
jgi:hypothetical protein